MNAPATPELPYVTVWNVIACKGRIGDHGSFKERLAFWLARTVAGALMRDETIRKEFTLSIGMEMIKHKKELETYFK